MDNDMVNLANLEPQEKEAFIKALAGIASADNDLDQDEQEFIKSIAIIYGISEKEVLDSLFNASESDIIKSVTCIKDRKTKLELVKEMCMIAHVNKELKDCEILFLGKIAEAMGVGLDKVEQISAWVLDRIIWLEEGKLIFEER